MQERRNETLFIENKISYHVVLYLLYTFMSRSLIKLKFRRKSQGRLSIPVIGRNQAKVNAEEKRKFRNAMYKKALDRTYSQEIFPKAFLFFFCC